MSAWFTRGGSARKRFGKDRPYRRRLVAVPEFSFEGMSRARRGLPPRARRFLIGLGALFLLYLFVSGDRGAWRLLTLQKLRNEQAAEELDLTAQIADLDTRHRLLLSDTTYIEKIARTEYHLSRPDEIIYELTPKSVKPGATKDSPTR